MPVTPELAAELEQRARALGARDLQAWVGTENYEMRVAADGTWIDRRILDGAAGRGARAPSGLSLLAIDAGADGVTAVVVGDDGGVLAGGRHAFGHGSRSRAGSSTRRRRSGGRRWRPPGRCSARVDPARCGGSG